MVDSPRQPKSGLFVSPILRRADQAAVAVVLLVSLAAIAVYWINRGGHHGRLIEIDRARPQSAQFKLDVNTADWPELAQLPGIGETLSQRIVQVREADGPYQSHADLQRRVRGIGPRTLERIEPFLLPIAQTEAVAGP